MSLLFAGTEFKWFACYKSLLANGIRDRQNLKKGVYLSKLRAVRDAAREVVRYSCGASA